MRKNILSFLEETTLKFPNKKAVVDSKSAVTFEELSEKAKRIGCHINEITNGETNRPVVVFVDRNTESIISFIGTAYSGNFYVPVDSQMPDSRIKLIFEVLNPVLAITNTENDKKIVNSISYQGLQTDYATAVETEIDDKILDKIRWNMIDVDPLYLIFTSGSTGIPKGVLINHKSVIDLTYWLVNTFNFTEEDSLGNQTPFYFDASVKDIYIMLSTGATLHILPRMFFSFPKLLSNYLRDNKITTVLWATSAVSLIGNSNIMAENDFSHINKVFFAGEAMPGKQLNTWIKELPNTKFINLYGPTEVTVDSTYYIVDRKFQDDEYIPIGYPCQNKSILVLNESNELINRDNIGVVGELCMRGTGVAMGYYNNQQVSDEVFVQNPLHNNYRDIIYRTGDLVKYNEHGELDFVSRIDFQIKHMGHRIELGEIEISVNAIKGVKETACIYDVVNQKIVLFYSSHDNSDVDIINSIKDKVPKYMFPSKVVKLDSLPYNFNGKYDRVALKKMYKAEFYT